MYKMMLEPQHAPERQETPVDWRMLFRDLSLPNQTTSPMTALKAEGGSFGHAGHLWSSGIIRAPSQDFTIEYVQPLKFL